ncbi:beta-agarase [Psychrosphaera sp. 1_MG-2023]|uniref:beta-agarase n=1 Tax=Psychrosphaera sp. 1_MG-2023 TaxID=3062643 RepID=UPI0026E428EE|nr:beta-agarase [Psychrosphaera sp. 1_MG-2023]MDO6720742.1 beta-agarase [Psychrosphaera sp. 1_MG-2023]
MKNLILLSACAVIAPLQVNDWNDYPIPAIPPDGMIWELSDMSDDFNYTAPAKGKSEEFHQRWTEGFINAWNGPGLTEWHPEYSEVKNGYLRITTGRNETNGNVFAGSITSKQSIEYPVYMEVRAKISNMVTASNFWFLSKDSTQEIDVLEAYGSDRADQKWFSERLHLSHHVFIRNPFQDYQPKTDDTWYARNGIKWKDDFHTVGVYWRDPWHLEYYVDGKFIKSSSGKDIIDPVNYTEGSGLNKPMQAIINTESHDWRSDMGIAPTDEEINDPQKNIYLIDWVRFYKPVPKT